MNPLYGIKRRLYRGGRPGPLARGINWIQRLQHSSGLLVPRYAVTLDVQAARGQAVLHRRGSEKVQLTEVPVADRPPILRHYLAVAPGARPHFPVDRGASDTAFAGIADRYPVFRIAAR
ncbi:nitroreductase family deazaflavin-dependent oxidoreductase [Kribbella shirazensis]|uniref:Uncharacterized protein n=1 Tax=Kribbella shirazensis TaxID=1105143 RepID=A0A7X6A0I1_9ACTN|nr:nitroreductase family deazaflavin-dependent oxidoreductase [Kribbella shirazensis]NIK57227.1 hypothetical protein [Kribbella shirazensis]